MQDLETFDFEGGQEASSAEQLDLALSRRFDDGTQFEIAAFVRTYPMLDLLVSGDLAVVHYFAAEGKLVEFPENRAGTTFTMPGSTVVPMTTAMRCAEEFSIDLQRPTAVMGSSFRAASVPPQADRFRALGCGQAVSHTVRSTTVD